MEIKPEKNSCMMRGKLISLPSKINYFGEIAYHVELKICPPELPRTAVIHLIIPERITHEKIGGVGALIPGKYFHIFGEIRADRNGLMKDEVGNVIPTVKVLAQKIDEIDPKVEKRSDVNSVILVGQIYASMYVKERDEKRIGTFFLKVRETIIPVTVFGNRVLEVEKRKIGDTIFVNGDLASRHFVKRHADGSKEQKVSYEVYGISVGDYYKGRYQIEPER